MNQAAALNSVEAPVAGPVAPSAGHKKNKVVKAAGPRRQATQSEQPKKDKVVKGTVQLLNNTTSDKQSKIAEEIKLNVAAVGMDLLNNS